ncbi:MAG TPA: LuxR C-terminal-related transcriptional regulator [Gaiellaceae bacterium]|nr:LuxR C-terminal-related transcriptional regulator [Gaiellaceae bacterium]
MADDPRARPRPSPELQRSRLTRALQDSRSQLVLLSAPPGFGKSTLIRQWQAVDQRRFATLVLDRADNDVVFLWTRVIEAIRSAEPRFEGAAQIALHAPQADVFGAVLPLLARDLRLLEHELVIALDDYQSIMSVDCHESLRVMLHRLPANVTVALATRSDPPLALATLRARRELVEVRAVDLCFTDVEEAEYLTERVGLGLDRETLATLHERTEGWPAGVHLASLSLQKTDDPAEFVAGFRGTNRHVVDYLTEVVLDSLDPNRRRFLLETSILETISAPLADAVTGHSDSAGLLEEIERENLFLLALDDHREWYRYHQLFRDLLRAKLAAEEPARVPTLHLRAHEWHLEAGDPAEAIRQGLAAGSVEAACEVVASRWRPSFCLTEARTTLAWLEALPAEAVGADPRLLVAKAWAASMRGAQDEALGALEAARELGLDHPLPDGSSLEAVSALVEASFPRGDAGRMLAAALRLEALEPELDPSIRPLVHLALGWAHYLAGDERDAEAALAGAVLAAAERGQWRHVAIANALLTHLALAAANPELATLLARDAVRASTQASEKPGDLAAGLADLANGAVLARSSRAEARERLGRGLARLRVHGEPLLVAEALLLLAPVAQALQGTKAGRAHLAEARELLERCADPGILAERLEQTARSLTPTYRRAHEESELTERELEVLQYLADGLAKRDIATTLFLSYNTIHSHTKSIYQKLRVSSRQAAIEKARELGAL